MDRFLSNAVNRIDAKGRVSVPAHFRTVLQKRGFSDLYALQSIDMPAVDVGGPDLLQRYEDKLATQDMLAASSDDLSIYCHGDGAFLKLDQDGRIMVTDFIREQTGITSEVCFVGRGLFFQMWEPQAFQTVREKVRARLAAQRAATATPSGAPQ